MIKDKKSLILKIILGILIILIIAVLLDIKNLVNNLNEEESNEVSLNASCFSDQDCVPAPCCHATSCVPMSQAPSCKGVFCTMDCKPNTLDCGQGKCACVNNKCTALLSK